MSEEELEEIKEEIDFRERENMFSFKDKQIKDLYNEVVNLKQALNEIKKILTECKKLMSHEFDWNEQTDNILQIIDKYLGGSNENN